jgi:hypothetical protein
VTVLVSPSAGGTESSDAEYGRWVLEYLLGVKRELRQTRAGRGGAAMIQALQCEHDALLERIERRLAPAQATPGRDDQGSLPQRYAEQSAARRPR